MSEAQDRITAHRKSIEKADAENRLMLFEVYRDNLWKLDSYKSFKIWVAKETGYDPSKVQDWVISDSIRAELSAGGVDASQWSDEAILSIKFMKGDRLKKFAQGLPDNPTKEQIRKALKN